MSDENARSPERLGDQEAAGRADDVTAARSLGVPPSAYAPAAYPPPIGETVSESDSGYPRAPAPRPPLNGLAVAALICGILGLAPAAIVLGHVGFAQARRSGQRGRGLAIAGFLLGYLALVLLLVGALAYSTFVGGLRTDGYLPA